MQEISPVENRERYSQPVGARRELSEWGPYFQNLSENLSRTPKERSDARLLVEFANWAVGEFDRAAKLIQGLHFESVEDEIGGLESWISDMHWWDQERLQETIDFAQFRIDDLSEQLEKSVEYHGFYDLITRDYCEYGVATDALVLLRSEYRDYLNKVGPELRTSYATAMESLGVPSDAAIHYSLEMIGSAKFEPPREPELSASIEALYSPERYDEEDCLEILRGLENDAQLRRSHEPIKKSGLRLTDLPQPLASEETSPPPFVSPRTNDAKAGDILLPEMDFNTKAGRLKAVNDFITYILKTTGKQIFKNRIWKKRWIVSPTGAKYEGGYKWSTDFKDWQSGASKPGCKAAQYFEAILRLKIRIVA